MTDKELRFLAEKTVTTLKNKNLTLSLAESCTGGMASSYITSVSGVSEVYGLGVTSYSCEIKNKILSVPDSILRQYGAVSEETASIMAENIRILANSDIGASITGVAGPMGSEGHPPGYVFIAVSGALGTKANLLNIEFKSRDFVRGETVKALFNLIINYTEEIK